jgi:hypothetical protein
VIAGELALRLLVTTDTGGDHLQEAFARMAGIYELAAIARIEMQPRKLLLFALCLPRLDLYSCTPSIEILFACASDLAVQRRGPSGPPLTEMADLIFVGDLAVFAVVIACVAPLPCAA